MMWLPRLLAWFVTWFSVHVSAPSDGPADEALLAGAENGSVEDVRDALQRGADVAARTPVRRAARRAGVCMAG
jgi:hypothetical protein